MQPAVLGAGDGYACEVTPPGSVTPTVVTPRECHARDQCASCTNGVDGACFAALCSNTRFLSARREVNEVYHSHSPCGEACGAAQPLLNS